MKMDERKQKVLQAIILDYIATADPVGSRTISRKYDLGISPATVRNEMADLEDMGLIEQPHTSAGRVPTQPGYRYYVDCLLEKEPLRNDIKNVIRNTLRDKMKETEALIQTASKLLSSLTNYTSLIMAPFYGSSILKHIKLLLVEETKAVMVLVLDNGHVENRLLDVPEFLKEEDCALISDILTRHLRGLALDQWNPGIIQNIYSELNYHKRILRDIIDQVESILAVEQDQKVYLGGTINILNQPEFKHVEKIKSLLELLEEESTIKSLLSARQEPGVMVRIGSENPHEGMKDCSLITATYQIDGKVIGTVGVLGPTRMEYSKAISIVEYLSSALNEGLKKL